ncbi:hypothetical protein BDD12DRAFT_912978 [Trichophaea hybrida]|nr:hypothetical protein BDD12DRAFT_912978 [Trichophaea hybrida]
MLKSNRRNTKVERDSAPLEIRTVSDFLTLINHHSINRATIQYRTEYRTKVLGEGSQFTVHDGEGIHPRLNDFPHRAVKSLIFRSIDKDPSDRRKANEIYKELKILCNQHIRDHPNIIRLLEYDLVEDGTGCHSPALVLEKTNFSLSYLLSQSCPTHWRLDLGDLFDICLGATSGLLAMHRAKIVHGDIKADNVLVAYDMKGNYVAKLADFGSSIILDSVSSSHPARYYGTQITNAPETQNQSQAPIPLNMLARCDAYSLGILFLHIFAGELRESWTMKDEAVMERGIAYVEEEVPKDFRTALVESCRHLLPYDPKRRCSDLAIVEDILGQNERCEYSDTEMSEGEGVCVLHTIGRSEPEIDRSLHIYLGDSHYLTIGWPDEEVIPLDIQRQIVLDLRMQSTKGPCRGKAFFQLAIAHSIGLGGPKDVDAMLNAAVNAAKADYLPAQAVVHAWHVAHGKQLTVDHELQLDWLYEAVAWGSWTAGHTLQLMDQDLYKQARLDFHARGGYNQYFYSGQRPQYIGSDDFIKSLGSKSKGNEDISDLLQAAVIYGDRRLVETLIKNVGGDLNACNEFGESLVVLCCKSGHLDILEALKSLVKLGASARTHDDCGMKLRESALHWVVAFDNDKLERAADILFQAGSQLDDDIDWYHPCIELHGIFPIGGPLNYALKAYSFHAIKVLLQRAASIGVLKDVFSFKGSGPNYPVEYAIAQQAPDMLHELVQYGAFEDIDWLGNPVELLASMPRYQADAIGGFLGIKSGQSASKTIDFIAKMAPTLLYSIPEEAPPIILAAYCHNETVVKALLKHKCDGNAAFPTETGSITPLGEWAKNRLISDKTVAADLVEAGTDINQRSVGGNTPLHFAAGDNNAQVVKHLLDLGAQIEATSRSLTPLHTAAMYNAVDSGRVLLEKGANFCATTDWNRTSLYTFWSDLTPGALAANRCQRAFLDMLLEFDSTLIARPPSGDTLLHFAVSEPETRMLDFLLDFVRNAEPRLHAQTYLDMVNADGWTAMHLCVGNIRRQKHCESLVRAGANINQLSSSGHSILDIAKQTRERVKDGEVWEPPQEVKSRDLDKGRLLEYEGLPSVMEQRATNKGRLINSKCCIRSCDRKQQFEDFNRLIRFIEDNGGKEFRADAIGEGEFCLWRRTELPDNHMEDECEEWQMLTQIIKKIFVISVSYDATTKNFTVNTLQGTVVVHIKSIIAPSKIPCGYDGKAIPPNPMLIQSANDPWLKVISAIACAIFIIAIILSSCLGRNNSAPPTGPGAGPDSGGGVGPNPIIGADNGYDPYDFQDPRKTCFNCQNANRKTTNKAASTFFALAAIAVKIAAISDDADLHERGTSPDDP